MTWNVLGSVHRRVKHVMAAAMLFGYLTLFIYISGYFISTSGTRHVYSSAYLTYVKKTPNVQIYLNRSSMPHLSFELSQTPMVGLREAMNPTYNVVSHLKNNLSEPILSHKFNDVNVPVVISSTVGTNTMEPREVRLEDVYIAVKTTVNNYRTRVKVILDTWHTLADQFVYFFTDSGTPGPPQPLGKNLVVTSCGMSHNPGDLLCKMEAELSHYYKFMTRWFCHFDDDNYVNIPVLLSMLTRYNHSKALYLGRMSRMAHSYSLKPHKVIPIRFATGGAGFCLSQSLMKKMRQYVGEGLLNSTILDWFGHHITDDVALGFVISHLLMVNLTEMDGFHSHLRINENAADIPLNKLHNQISLGYRVKARYRKAKLFLTADDPTGLRHIHCYLHRKAKHCEEFTVKDLDENTKLGEIASVV